MTLAEARHITDALQLNCPIQITTIQNRKTITAEY